MLPSLSNFFAFSHSFGRFFSVWNSGNLLISEREKLFFDKVYLHNMNYYGWNFFNFSTSSVRRMHYSLVNSLHLCKFSVIKIEITSIAMVHQFFQLQSICWKSKWNESSSSSRYKILRILSTKYKLWMVLVNITTP